MSKVVLFPQRRVEFLDLARRIQPAGGLRPDEWTQHANGGGWIQRSAHADPTAYLGPFTIVSGEARVLQNARILDEASVTGMAIIGGQAIVGGSAYVGGQAKIGGTAKVLGTADVGAFFSMSEGEITAGTHRPLGRSHRRRWEQYRVA